MFLHFIYFFQCYFKIFFVGRNFFICAALCIIEKSIQCMVFFKIENIWTYFKEKHEMKAVHSYERGVFFLFFFLDLHMVSHVSMKKQRKIYFEKPGSLNHLFMKSDFFSFLSVLPYFVMVIFEENR